MNPFDTLNPSMTVGSRIIRVLEKFGVGENQAKRQERMLELLDLVKLPRVFATRVPRQLSGRQKQRIDIAPAFAGSPEIVVADEPVSALDVSVEAAIAEVLMHIQRISAMSSNRARPTTCSRRPITPIRRRSCWRFRSPTHPS